MSSTLLPGSRCRMWSNSITFARSMIGRVVKPGLVNKVLRRNCPAIIRIQSLSVEAARLALSARQTSGTYETIWTDRTHKSHQEHAAFAIPCFICTQLGGTMHFLFCGISRLFSTDRQFSRFFDIIPFIERHHNFSRLTPIIAADNPIFGHPVDHSSATSVSNP